MIPKIAAFRATETELASNDEARVSPKKGNITRFGLMASKNLEPWGDGGNQLTQFVQFMKGQQSVSVKDLLQFRQAGQDHRFEHDHAQSPHIVNLRGSIEAEGTSPSVQMKPADSKEGKYMLLKCGLDSGSSQKSHGFVNAHSFQPASITNLSCGNPCSSDDKNSIGSWSSLYSDAEAPPSIDSLTFPLHGLGAFECNQIASDFQSILYDELQYNCEYLSDFFEAPMVDDGLFTWSLAAWATFFLADFLADLSWKKKEFFSFLLSSPVQYQVKNRSTSKWCRFEGSDPPACSWIWPWKHPSVG